MGERHIKSKIIYFTLLTLTGGCLPVIDYPTQSTESNTATISGLSPNTTHLYSQTSNNLQTEIVIQSPMPSLYPKIIHTPLPTINEEDIPQWIIDGANITGMTPSDIVYVFQVITKAAEERKPEALLDFLQFPLHVAGRCPGDIIETPDEYIERYPELLNDETREDIISYEFSNLLLNQHGVGIGLREEDYLATGIWYGHYCNSRSCDVDNIFISGLFGYVTLWEMVEGYPLNPNYTPLPTYNPSEFTYGHYEASSIITMPGIQNEPLDESIIPWREFSVTISTTTLNITPYYDGGYVSCAYEMVEFCPVDESRMTPSWYGYDWPTIQIVCSDTSIYSFYILGEGIIATIVNNFMIVDILYDHYIIFKINK